MHSCSHRSSKSRIKNFIPANAACRNVRVDGRGRACGFVGGSLHDTSPVLEYNDVHEHHEEDE